MTDLPERPTRIYISSNVVNEDEAGYIVGVLSAEDEDEDEQFTFSLVEGEGDIHNGNFEIQANLLKVAALQSDTQEYEIRV